MDSWAAKPEDETRNHHLVTLINTEREGVTLDPDSFRKTLDAKPPPNSCSTVSVASLEKTSSTPTTETVHNASHLFAFNFGL